MTEQFERRALVTRRIIQIGIIFALLGIAADAGDYFRRRTWHSLADAGFVALSLLCLVAAWSATRRNRLNAAAYWIVTAIVVGIGTSELLWIQPPMFTISVALLIPLVGILLVPRRWVIWLMVTLAYIFAALLLDRFPLMERRVLTQSSELTIIYGVVFILIFIIIVWQYAILRGRTYTIRSRLLMTYVPLSLLLAFVIGGSAFLMARNQVRRQVENQLESVATLKEAEIQTWLNDLLISLNVVASGQDVPIQLEIILASPSIETTIYQDLQAHLQWAIDQMGLYEEMFVMDLQGQVILSTDPTQQGKVYVRETFFERGLTGPYVDSPSYSPSLGETLVLAVRPVINQTGETIAVLAGRADMEALSEIMLERSGLGETGETYLVGTNYAQLTRSRFEIEGRIYVRTEGATTAIEQNENGVGRYTDYRDVAVVGVYHWLPDFQVALLAEQDVEEAFRGVARLLLVDAGVAFAALVIVVTVSIVITNNITNPLASLTETAQQIAAGDREQTAVEAQRQDEIGALARAFNSMTRQLRDFIGGLEARVDERTRQLAQRSAYLEASAEVSQIASSILDREQLVREVARLIRERFDFYYVGLFLVEGDWAVLRAGTGRAGREMLAEEHRLRVGGDSMIGQCVERAEARVALDVGEEAVRFDNPLLPETHSEGALPLSSRGQVLGALSIQSTEPDAFDRDTLTLLQTMADQVAVALDNAQLFTEVEESLEAERRAYGELSRQAWAELLRTRSDWGYDYVHASLSPAQGDWTPAMQRALKSGKSVRLSPEDRENGVESLAIPLKVRDAVVGVLSFNKEASGKVWTNEERTLLETLTAELGLALESARLYRDTQRRAAQERQLGEMSARFTETLDLDALLRAAVQELGQLPNVIEASVQIGEGPTIPVSKDKSHSDESSS